VQAVLAIRLALGADRRRVWNMVVVQGMSLALGGVLIGLVAALALSRLFASFLYGVTARDPVIFVGSALRLGGVAFVGVWLPARRASSIDPALALRTE
jgi:ABC-type antimicrobial peptide transport system permease subunit